MANRIVRPNISTAVVRHLTATMDIEVRPSTKRQAIPRQITITRVGGPSISVVHEQAMVTIQAWSTVSNKDAEDLALEARSWIEQIDEPECWFGHEIGGVVDYPDGVVGTHRYQFTVSLMARGVQQ